MYTSQVAIVRGIPNMYFMVGNLSGTHFYSKVVTFQIKTQQQQLRVFGDQYTLSMMTMGSYPGFYLEKQSDPLFN